MPIIEEPLLGARQLQLLEASLEAAGQRCFPQLGPLLIRLARQVQKGDGRSAERAPLRQMRWMLLLRNLT